MSPQALHQLDTLLAAYALEHPAAGIRLVSRIVHEDAEAHPDTRPPITPPGFVEIADGVWVPESWEAAA